MLLHNKEQRQSYLKAIALGLGSSSNDVCKANDCTKEEHFCETNAYFNIELDDQGNITSCVLEDICTSDFLIRKANTIIYFPFHGTGEDLEQDLMDNYTGE